MLGAKQVGSQRVPVVLDPYIATSFLGLLAPALSGEAVQKGRSLFAGKVGQQVASNLVTIVDDGSCPVELLPHPSTVKVCQPPKLC
ncbi:hypothetical protein N752_13430 [Desulforamulus aquiferis]|nr:hypothetical protein N752_13430 [Desulforamulus aquiferis]